MRRVESGWSAAGFKIDTSGEGLVSEFHIQCYAKIDNLRSNTITLLFDKRNIMFIFSECATLPPAALYGRIRDPAFPNANYMKCSM